MKKHTLIVNTNHELASKVLAKSEDERKEILQHYLDLSMLSKNLLQGEGLENFIAKAKNFIQA
jgi:HSP90 family molecular chaperone